MQWKAKLLKNYWKKKSLYVLFTYGSKKVTNDIYLRLVYVKHIMMNEISGASYLVAFLPVVPLCQQQTVCIYPCSQHWYSGILHLIGNKKGFIPSTLALTPFSLCDWMFISGSLRDHFLSLIHSHLLTIKRQGGESCHLDSSSFLVQLSVPCIDRFIRWG